MTRKAIPGRSRLRDESGVALVTVLMLMVVMMLSTLSATHESTRFFKTVQIQKQVSADAFDAMGQASLLYSRVVPHYNQARAFLEGKPSIYWNNMMSAANAVRPGGENPAQKTSLSFNTPDRGAVNVLVPGGGQNVYGAFFTVDPSKLYMQFSYRIYNALIIRRRDPSDPNNSQLDTFKVVKAGMTVEICPWDAVASQGDKFLACGQNAILTLQFVSPFDYPFFVEDKLNWAEAGSGATIVTGDLTVKGGLGYFGGGPYDPDKRMRFEIGYHTPKEPDDTCGGNPVSCITDNSETHVGDYPNVGMPPDPIVAHSDLEHVIRMPFPEPCKFPPDDVGTVGKECYKPFTDLMNCIDNCKNYPSCSDRFDNGGPDGKLSCLWDDSGTDLDGDGLKIDQAEPFTDDTLVSSIGSGFMYAAGGQIVRPGFTANNGGATYGPGMIPPGWGGSWSGNTYNANPPGCAAQPNGKVPFCLWGLLIQKDFHLCLDVFTDRETYPWTPDPAIAQNIVINGNLNVTSSQVRDECCQGTMTSNCGCKDITCVDCCDGKCNMFGFCLGQTFGCGLGCTSLVANRTTGTGECGTEIRGTVTVLGNARFNHRFRMAAGSKLYVLGNLELYDADLPDTLAYVQIPLITIPCGLIPVTRGVLMFFDWGGRATHIQTKEESVIYTRGDLFVKGSQIDPLTKIGLGTYTFFCSLASLLGLSCPTPAPAVQFGPRPNTSGETNDTRTILDDAILLVRGLTPTIRDSNSNGILDNGTVAGEETQEGNDLNYAWNTGQHRISHFKWDAQDMTALAKGFSGGLAAKTVHMGRAGDTVTSASPRTQWGDYCCHAPCDAAGNPMNTLPMGGDSLTLQEAINKGLQNVPIKTHVHVHTYDREPWDDSVDDWDFCSQATGGYASGGTPPGYSAPPKYAPRDYQAYNQATWLEQFFAQPSPGVATYWNGAGAVPITPVAAVGTNPKNENFWAYAPPAFKGHADAELWVEGGICGIVFPYQNLAVYGTIFSGGSLAVNQTTVGLGNIVTAGTQLHMEHVTEMLLQDIVCMQGSGDTNDANNSFNLLAGGDLFLRKGLGRETFACGGVDLNSVCSAFIMPGCINSGFFSGRPHNGIVWSNGKAGFQWFDPGQAAIWKLLNANSIRVTGNMMIRHLVTPQDRNAFLQPLCNIFGANCTFTNRPCLRFDESGFIQYTQKATELGFTPDQLVRMVKTVFNDLGKL